MTTPVRRGLSRSVRDVSLVGAGLVAVGGGSAAALAVAARALDARDFATFATWWTASNLAGLAFVVVEMYLPRLLLAGRARGHDERPVLRTFTRATLLAVGAAAAALLLCGPWIIQSLLAGQAPLLPLLLAYMLASALQTLQRGVAVGRGRFRVFTVQLGVDGLVRVVGALALAASGRASATGFAAVLCLAAASGVTAGTAAGRHWSGWRGAGSRVPLRPVGLLALASLGPLIVNNAGVPWLASVDSVDPVAIGAVAGALTLSRIPTLLVGAAYGPVLAPLAAAAEAGSSEDFRLLHRRAVSAAILLAGLFTVAFALAGTALLTRYLGAGFSLPRVVLAAMAAGSGMMFVCVVEQAALVALSAWSRSALAWTVAVAAFGAALLTPGEPVLRVATAVCVAPLMAAAVMWAARARAQRTVFAPG